MAHRFTFVRLGGFDQVRLETGADLAALDGLDPKLWAALSCPVKGLALDERTLALLDTDGDGRIRVPEIRAAVRFALDRLADPDALARGIDPLPLSAIKAGDEAGRALVATAKLMLETAGKAGAAAISVAEAEEAVARFDAQPFNGDGVVTEDATADPALLDRIRTIVAVTGGVPDRGGKRGVDGMTLDKFHDDAAAWLAWRERGRAAEVLVAGEGTAAAAAAVRDVAAKVDDFFARVGLAAFDERSAAALDAAPEAFARLSSRALTDGCPEIAELPLARVGPARTLPLGEGVNPAWRSALETFARVAVKPLLGHAGPLAREEWLALRERLAPYEAWRASDPAPAFAALDEKAVAALLAADRRADLHALVAKDRARDAERSRLAEVVRLVRYARDLAPLLQNFVTFRRFYAGERAIFQAGTLYLDGRSLDLCVRVEDAAAHAALAAGSCCFLAYCECRRADLPPMQVACAVTDGEAAFLTAGRNGLFVDRQGRDWHATVVRTVDHPVSLREAFFAPWRKAANLLEETVAKFAGDRGKEADAGLAAGVAAPAGPVPFDVAKMAGVFAAIGLALGALGTAAATVVSGLLALPAWQAPLVLLGLLLLVSGPSMLLAWLKLRRRSLAPILDACGFAINTRARINVPFGRSLTALATLPAGSARELADPFAERGVLRRLLVWTVIVALVVLGVLLLHPKGAAMRPAPVPRMVAPEANVAPAASAPAPVPPAPAPAKAD